MNPFEKVTVLGGQGFIGRHLVRRLRETGSNCWVPERADPDIMRKPLGLVFYCIGLTANFRSHPFETVDAHVGVLRDLLEHADFDRLIYLSSTRVYDGCDATQEDQPLLVRPASSDHLYNLSKLMGESLALSCQRNGSVVRLSNVLGPDMGATNFVGSLLQEAQTRRAVHFMTAPESSKDYLWIDDAVDGLIAIAERGQRPIYNLASGENLSHATLAAWLEQAGVGTSFRSGAPMFQFPVIATANLTQDTGFAPQKVNARMSGWLARELASDNATIQENPT